jgi:hypothetical protein
MKTVILTLVLLLAGFMNLYSQHVVVATLKVDYNTYMFEGGNLSEYFCTDCSNASLPFGVDYLAPGDFGSIVFQLKPTADTIFYATIIWMGTGQIYYPKVFSKVFPYLTPGLSERTVPYPERVTYYDMNGQITTDSAFIKKAIPAWYAIDTLLITRAFAKHPYQAAFYLYPPSVGVFNPNVAKWIIFLYLSGKDLIMEASNNKEVRFNVSPNPASDYLYLSGFSEEMLLRYELLDVSGRTIALGDVLENTISLTGLNGGVYLLRLSDKDGVLLETLKVLKR